MNAQTQRVIMSNRELTTRLLDVRTMELALVRAFRETRTTGPDWLLQAWGAFQQGMSPDHSLGPVPEGTWEYLQEQLDIRERKEAQRKA